MKSREGGGGGGDPKCCGLFSFHMHAWVGCVGEFKSGLIAAAGGAFADVRFRFRERIVNHHETLDSDTCGMLILKPFTTHSFNNGTRSRCRCP